MRRDEHAAVGRPLHTYSFGLLRDARVRRILELSGFQLTTGWPNRNGRVAVWGSKPVAGRGRWVSRRAGSDLITLEDGFLRSLEPGVTGAPPISLILDDIGIYYDASCPSRLEKLIASGEFEARRSVTALDKLRASRLSKYTPLSLSIEITDGYVVVVDQTRGDASICGAGASEQTFQRMLEAARTEYPNTQIVIKSHPDVLLGYKSGHFTAADLRQSEILLTEAINPWDLIENARCVYTVSSQMGYEAILAGRPVRCFGLGFYAGWGLTEDDVDSSRRATDVSREALFYACHLAYPTYYDAWRDQLTDFETALDILTHERDAIVPDNETKGDVFVGMRLWKRRAILRMRGRRSLCPVFAPSLSRGIAQALEKPRDLWIWASKAEVEDPRFKQLGDRVGYVEDGFLRSVGLGAELAEPASFVFDRRGIYFDPTRPSDLEVLIESATAKCPDIERAARLRAAIVAARVTKYNLAEKASLDQEKRWSILVPGQVEDDASILRGTTEVSSNLALLEAVRAANPTRTIVYKPHPDVEAGLRSGGVPPSRVLALADDIAENVSPTALLDQVDEVWTMTSLLGFEALLRGKQVTCFGMPFFAGWGLTDDRGMLCPRRKARPTLDQLVWAALIAYPCYRDPVSGLPCSPELIVERLSERISMRQHTLLSKAQGLLASQNWLWRR